MPYSTLGSHIRYSAGSRDGKIMLWDARSSGQGGARGASACRRDMDGVPQLSPVCVLDAAHGTTGSAAPGRGSRAHSRPSPVTVTSVAFVPHSYVLASGGSHDTTVKLWDMRMQGLPLCDLEMPKQTAAAALGTDKVPHSLGTCLLGVMLWALGFRCTPFAHMSFRDVCQRCLARFVWLVLASCRGHICRLLMPRSLP